MNLTKQNQAKRMMLCLGIVGLGALAGCASPPAAAPEISPSPIVSPSPVQPPTPVVVAPAQGDRQAAQVISTGDGDGLRAQINGQPVTIRLACIDAPETAQPYGQEAAARLRALLPRDTAINVRVVDTDRYGRTVAEVYRAGQSVNLQLVAEGHAVVYREYLSGCRETEAAFLAAEDQARSRRVAFWSQAQPIMPWEWRQGIRGTTEAAPEPVAAAPEPGAPAAGGKNCDPAYPGVCIPPAPPDLDCKDVSFRRFEVRPPDPHGFDGDGDGVGCEG